MHKIASEERQSLLMSSYGQFHEFKVYGMKFYLLPIHTKALFNLPYESTKQPNKSTSYGESKRDHHNEIKQVPY